MRDQNSLNKVLLIGHLGSAPEVRYLPQTERAVARFSLATNERYYNPNSNESDSRTEWHRIVAWGKLAEFCEKILAQGKQVCVEGKLRTRSWQDREGNKRYTTEIEAFNIILLGKREGSSEDDGYGVPDSDQEDKEPMTESTPDDDDEIPF